MIETLLILLTILIVCFALTVLMFASIHDERERRNDEQRRR